VQTLPRPLHYLPVMSEHISYTLGHFTFWISFFRSAEPLSETTVTHRLQGVIIVGIYMSSNIYDLLFIIFKQKYVMQMYTLADV